MKLIRMTAVTGALLGSTILAAGIFAAAPADREQRAMERLQRAAAEHVRILTELSAQLPEQSRADLTTAIEAARGLEKAMSAPAPDAAEPAKAAEAASPAGEAPEGEPDPARPARKTREEAPDPADDDPAVDHPGHTTGLVHAREQMVAAFDRHIAHLTEVMGKVPENAAAKIQLAITRIQENRARTLANKDRVMADKALKPEKGARPERAEKPQKPEKAERPQRAERPARPENPRP